MDNMVIIKDKNKFKIIEINGEKYVIDISSHWWSCLCGLFVWFFPMKAYWLDKNTELKITQNNVLNTILGTIGLILVVVVYSVFRPLRIIVTGEKKLVAIIIGFLLIFGLKLLLRYIDQKTLFVRARRKKMITISLKCSNISQIAKCILLDVFLQGVIGISFVFIYIFSDNVSGIYFMALLGIWIFLSVGEWTKNPLGNKKYTITVDKEG